MDGRVCAFGLNRRSSGATSRVRQRLEWMMERRRYCFHGRVQRVGFRATAAGIAERLNLTGWVRNLTDGTVELLAVGPEGSIEELLAKLEERFEITESRLLPADDGSTPPEFSIQPDGHPV